MTPGNVEYLVQRAAAINGGNYIGNIVPSPALRAVLHELATECGVLAPIAATDKDLIALYSVARKSPVSASQVAERINAKAGAGTPASRFPAAPTPPQAPSAPVAPVADMERLARAIAEDVVAPLRTTLTRHAQENEDKYGTMRRELANMVASVRDTANAAIAEAVATFKASEPVSLVVTMPNAAPLPVGLVHRATPRIIRALAAGLNVYLHGPAGSGKTTAANKSAEALNVPFYFAAKVESEYLLLGFKDARGETVRTQFREAYENGGVFLFDEMDASSPAAIVALNAALANGICAFPDGTIKRHEKFYCIGAGNTVLTGANRQYSGRVQMDAASIDRFYFLEFGYDESLEMELATNKGWCLHVQALRKAVAERGLSHLVTPRATFDGCKALEAGDTWAEAEMACIFKGLDSDTVDQLRRATSLFAGNSQAA